MGGDRLIAVPVNVLCNLCCIDLKTHLFGTYVVDRTRSTWKIEDGIDGCTCPVWLH